MVKKKTEEKKNPLRQMADVAIRMRASNMVRNNIELENHKKELVTVAKTHDELITAIKKRESEINDWDIENDAELAKLFDQKDDVDNDLALLHEIVAQFELNEIN